MKKLSIEKPCLFPVEPTDAFALGALHDIGYGLAKTKKERSEKGGLILKEQNYKYWKEVYYHGIYQTEYSSAMLILLNYADLTTGKNGEDIAIQQVIINIIYKYGKNSSQEKEIVKLIRMIQESLQK